tara:strand:- start:621 stop:2687 length:2067 start_codon:yes stop_codon:yes gene_type:complete
MIYIKKLLIGVSILPMLSGQNLCPPAFLETYSYDQKVDLYWEQTSSYGDVLFNECFASCSTASEQMMVVNDTSLCGNCSGGWFRYDDGSDADCGAGMYPCTDGGGDDFSALAGYSGLDSTTGQYSPVDSRLIGSVDLSGYTAAYIEFIEAYNYPGDATGNNTLEISTDGGMSWDTVYVSDPDSVGYDYWFNTVEISEYAGQDIMFAFRYYCPLGYGEDWFVDDIKISGGYEGQGDLCGTISHYNIYQDGFQIATTVYDETEYVMEGLDNGVEYCFSVAAAYGEGQSSLSSEVCATPMGPFQVNPSAINFDILEDGDYQESVLHIENFDSLDADFLISSIELSNIYAAMDLSLSTFDDGTLGDLVNVTDLGEEWVVGDSATSASSYLPFPEPPDGSTSFALYNDDAAGDDPMNPATPMIYSNSIFSGVDPSILVFDLYFPNPSGPCETGGTYSEDLKLLISTDDGVSWVAIDDNIVTGWYWASYMYNLEPFLDGASSFRIGFEYDDCGGNWGYGVAVDRVAIKMGDDFTWLTVSPFSGNVAAFSTQNDSIGVKIGAYGVYDNLQIEDELLIESGQNTVNISIGVGVEVLVENSNITPLEFALHQNYPNPFNPQTNIKFDLSEKAYTSLAIFNLVGQKVATLISKTMDAGSYSVKWEGFNDNGSALPTGMYIYELKNSGQHFMKKMVLVK